MPKPYAELLEFNQPNPIKLPGHTRIRDSFQGLASDVETGEFMTLPNGDTEAVYEPYYNPERIMEFAGRWDYGENNARKLGETVKLGRVETTDINEIEDGRRFKDVQVPIIRKYLSMGHESMIEMGFACFFLECSRVVSHELVRHRIASYQQESQRFVKYDIKDAITGWMESFYIPEGLDDIAIWPSDYADDNAAEVIYRSYKEAWFAYQLLREKGVAPQLARYVLPNGFRTRIVIATNIREWRHILRLRLDRSAQPEMQALMQQIYDQLVMIFPNALHGILDQGRGTR